MGDKKMKTKPGYFFSPLLVQHFLVDVSDKSSRHTPCAVRETVIRSGIR